MIQLTEIEQLGLKVLALIRAGKLNAFKCSLCSDVMQKNRNCVRSSDHEVPVYYHKDIGELFACPLRFISNSVYSFVDEYDYREKYPSTAPSYKDENPRFWASVKFYEDYKNGLERDKTNNTDENMSKVASLFNKEK